MRQDLETQAIEEPKRMNYAENQLIKNNIKILDITNCSIHFLFKDELCTIWPYSGWHSGKTIKDGRGINNLLNQIK